MTAKHVALISLIIISLSFAQNVFASNYSVEAFDDRSVYGGYGEGIGNTGYNYVMRSKVVSGRHINSINICLVG